MFADCLRRFFSTSDDQDLFAKAKEIRHAVDSFTPKESNLWRILLIPILQNVSPGEIQNAQNALDFAKALVTGWLSKYKFKNWQTHSTTEKTVTEADRRKRAAEIADQLCDHGQWKTHGRSINIEALRNMKLKLRITRKIKNYLMLLSGTLRY